MIFYFAKFTSLSTGVLSEFRNPHYSFLYAKTKLIVIQNVVDLNSFRLYNQSIKLEFTTKLSCTLAIFILSKLKLAREVLIQNF